MRREERVTVQGPIEKQQPDGMSHGGGGETGDSLIPREAAMLLSLSNRVRADEDKIEVHQANAPDYCPLSKSITSTRVALNALEASLCAHGQALIQKWKLHQQEETVASNAVSSRLFRGWDPGISCSHRQCCLVRLVFLFRSFP